MSKKYGKIVGWGAYAPNNIVTNKDLEAMTDTSDEWIVRRTGIRERRFAEPGETTRSMAVTAAERALAQANLSADEVDLIIVATTTPDYMAPSVSSQVQASLGIFGVPAFQMMTGCSGFVYALAQAYQFISTGAYRNVLVIAAELLSRYLDMDDRSTAVLFGDGAGAVVVQATDAPCGLLGFELGSDGASGENLVISLGYSEEITTIPKHLKHTSRVYMNGREVFKFASRVIGRSCQRALDQAGLTLDDIDWIVPHQANVRIIQAAAREMGVPISRFLVNISRYANTSAASVPLVLNEYLNNGTIKPHDTVLMVAFGAGLTWGSAVVQLQPEPAPPLAVHGRRAVAAD